ncbi:hypothetical protein FKP32DRAFT_1758677 [Trametes sanguinea]|nr:hypothetical protein FKP32DRAFT_1758677 [Trametes sanguinea]
MASCDQALATDALPWIDRLLTEDRIGGGDVFRWPWTGSLLPWDTVCTTELVYPDPYQQVLPQFDEVLVNNYLAAELYRSPQSSVPFVGATTISGPSLSSCPSPESTNGIYALDGTFVSYVAPTSSPSSSFQIQVEGCDGVQESPFVVPPHSHLSSSPPIVPAPSEAAYDAPNAATGALSVLGVEVPGISEPASACTVARRGRGKRPRTQDRAQASVSHPRKSETSTPQEAPSSNLKAIRRRNALASSSVEVPTATPSGWNCPYCSHVQSNRRSPDFKRHIETHTRPCAPDAALWVCCGVPLIDAREEYGVPETVLAGEPFVYEGMFMVGGCRRVFSRRDALSRHLRAHAGGCFGDPQASYLPGNKARAR